ncbi:IPT/TIG domain-containing protein [Actinoplanes sp. GCM10030250]|uniref:IPT/TIG domain-containing protein n=1 Tax=Actinoplanes sp. GCM10030250 TaxID=3273376 RepID=UPI0036114D8C
MRSSTSRSRARLLCAGLTTTGALGASIFVGAPAAFAAALDSLLPIGGPAGTTIKIDAAGTPFDTGNPAAIFTTGFAAGTTTCPNYTTSITGQTVVVATSPTKIDSDEATFTVPTTVTLNSGAARDWKVCVYNGTTASTAAVNDNTGGGTFTVTPAITFSPANGPSGGGNTITFTSPSTTNLFSTAVGLVFTDPAIGCAATYGTPGNLAAALTRPSATSATATVPAGAVGTGPNTSYLACFYSSTASGGTLVGASSTGYAVTLPPATVSSSVGPWAGGNGISVDSTSPFLLGVSSPGVTFNSSERCPRTFTAASSYAIVHPAAGKIRKASDNRLAVTVPALASGAPSVPTPFNLCVYNGTGGSSLMIATVPYTASVAPNVTAVSPSSGSAMGGNLITVSGSAFPTSAGSITATLGGLPLADITPVNETTFTARTPMHSVERNVSIVVNTPAGSKSLANSYSFLNAIAVTPNAASTDMKAVTVAVKGIGFLSADWGTAAAKAHIYLTKGTYNPANNGAGAKVNGQVSECGDVLPLSDNELICTLRLDQKVSAAGTITPEIAIARSATDIATTQNSRLISSASTAAFAADDVGKPITQTGGTDAVPAGSTIVDVLSATQAIISKQASATVNATVTARIGAAPVRSVVVGNVSSTVTLTAPSDSFTSADIGRVIAGTGITPGTTIEGILANGAGVTLSAAATTTGGPTVDLYDPIGVPAGAYTLTFVTTGTMGVDTTLTSYSQSTVSANSSFTLAAS